MNTFSTNVFATIIVHQQWLMNTNMRVILMKKVLTLGLAMMLVEERIVAQAEED
ncbi:MAG: hypothetical protein KAX49_10915 [Halanaerobiales bacterium]|nr:hypothetical protein [Halanaerobiales bacterium]